MKTAYSILQTMTVNPFQNLVINFLTTALSEGGYPDTELYFDQLTPLAILSETAEETGQTISQVEDDINEQAENPAAIEDKGSVDTAIDDEVLQMSNPNFTKEYEIYKK
jgi:hypothetical protein